VGHLGARLEPAALGRDPHLDVAAGGPAGGIHLPVAYPPSGRDPPDQPGPQPPDAALAVALLELPLHDPGDDLHLLVVVVAEPGAAPEGVVVAGDQEAVVRVVGLVVPPEAEAVPGVEPARLVAQAGTGPDHLDRGGEDRAPHDVFLDRTGRAETHRSSSSRP